MIDKEGLPYTELMPGTTEHKAFIADAIMAKNFAKLASLKNRIDQPIHVVSNWFYYSLMKVDNPEKVVVIYSPEDTETMQRLSQPE